MSAYDDLIPGTSPSRRRSAYDDLLPGGAPAATVQPAEDARLAGVEAATVPRVSDVMREALPDLWGEAKPEEPMVAPESTDASDNLYQPPGAEWGQVLRSIIPGAGAQIRSAVANLRRMQTEGAIASREQVLRPDAPRPEGTTLPGRVRRAVERQQALLEAERASLPAIEADAAAARQDLATATPQDMSTVQQAVHSAATSAPTTLTGLAVGIGARSPGLGMLIAGGGGSTIQAGSTYGEALEKLLADGVPKGEAHRRASFAATGDAAIEGFDALPVGVALKFGSPFAKRLLKTAGAESMTEGGQQLLQDLRAKAMENPELTLGEMWQNLKVSVLAGGIGGSVYGGIGSAANAGRKGASEGAGATQAPVDQPVPAEPVVPAEAVPAAPVEAVKPAPPVPSPYADLIPARVVDESAQFEERATAAEAAWTAKVDAMNARQTAKIEAAKAAAVVPPAAGPAPAVAKEPVKSSTSIDTAKTGQPFEATLMRGQGRADSPYNELVPQEAVLGPGRYTTGNAEFAKSFGPKVTEHPIKLENPLVIDTDAQWRALTKRAGWEFPNPISMSGDTKKASAGIAKLRSLIEADGHDGIVVRVPESEAVGKTMQKVFGESQVVEFKQPKSLGMPAGTITAGTFPTAAAAGATPPARAQATVGKESARPDAIRTAMRELFGAPISEKHQGAKNLGIYRVKPQTIRLKNRNDLRTAAHEVGHHISERNQPFRAVMKQHAAELISIMPAAYKAQVAAGKHMPKKLQIEEGFAEFIADYITEPTTLQAKVPGFYKAFETWLGQNPEYAQSLQRVSDMVGAHEALDPADRILAKVGMFKPPFGERVATLASKDSWDTFAQATLDKWHPLKVMVEDLAPGLSASKNPYAAARLLAGDAAIIEDWVSDFTTPFDYTKRLDGKNYGKPLRAIFEPILKGGEVEINKFKAYLIARRAFELKRAGKENLFTTEEIAQGLSLETPLFKKTAAEVYAYNDRLVDYAVEGGLLSPEVAEKFKQYANYIPFFRESEGDAKGGGRGDPFKRLMGGTANLRDPIANLIQNTANIIHATNRNAMVRKAVELAKAVPGGGRWIETVALPQQAHNISTQRILDELQAQGVQIDTTMAENMAAMQTFFMPSGKGDERTRTIVYKQGGELKAAQVNDPILWKALGNIPPLQMGLVNKILAFPAQTLRAGVVLDPTFMVRNFVRDTLSATVQSKGKFIPVLSTAQGIKMMAQSRDAYRLWRAFGGSFADQFRDSEEAVRVIQRMGRRGGFSPDSIISPMRWLDALKRVGAFTESGSRIGEFDATYKPGDIDSALQAALNAREVSTDFGMRGGSEAIQILTRMTPFMNPAMQGLYKTARVLSTGDGKAAAVKAAVLGTNMALLSMALALINSDEDWYLEIEEWEKTTYWHFKVGEQVYRIPKPFEYGTLFASIPEAIALYLSGKEDGEDFKKRMLQALGFVFGFRVIPQVGTLVMEPWANKSFFTGRKLVPDRQQGLEPGLQAHPSSSKVAQAAGEAANVSPAVIDNVVRNFFGTMGVHASTVADLMLEQTGAFPPGRERGWQTWPAIKAFVRDPDNPNSKQMRDFYEALEKYRTAVRTVKEYRNRGEDAKADRYAVEKSEEISMAKSAEVASRRLAKLRKAVRQIEWTRDMTPTEKRETVRDYNDEMQSIAAEQTRLYQAAKKSYSRPAIEGGQ